MDIPSHIKALKSYNPGKPIEEICKEYGITRPAVLWNNENNRGVSSRIEGRVREALEKSNLYPDPLSMELRSMLANRVGCGIGNVAVENGSEALLYRLNQAFLGPEDEILTSEGTFVAVYIWAQAANRKIKKVPLTSEYAFDLAKMSAEITDKTKLIYIANPNNPTGTTASDEELQAFVNSVPKHIIVVIDEAYAEYARSLDDDYSDSTVWGLPNVITLRTFSKAYGLAGVRIGYAIGGEELIEALNKVRMTFSPGSLAQASAIGALEDENYLVETVRLNAKTVKLFHEAIDDLAIKRSDSKGNFVMIDLESAERAAQMTQELMKNGVFVRHLAAFGLPTCVRISTGLPFENEMFIEALKSWMAKL